MTMTDVQHHIRMKRGDIGETVFLPGDPFRSKFIADHFDESHFVVENREFVTYTGKHEGLTVSVTSTGVGCPGVAIAVEELANIGAKNLIRIGTGGVLSPDVEPGSIIIATGAVRGDGTSKEYLPTEFPAVASLEVVESLIEGCKQVGVKPHVGIIRCHDAFYMESVLARGNYLERDRPWIEANVLCTENESGTLFTVGHLRKVRVGTILAVAGHHITKKTVPEKRLVELLSLATRAALHAAKLLAG